MPFRRLLAPALAIAMLTGCPGVINVVVPPTAGDKSPAPKDAKATPKPTGTASPNGDACVAPKGLSSASARLGVFAGKALTPELSKLTSEAAVRAAIARLREDKAAWACFQRNYPAATVAFLGEPDPAPTPGILLPSTMPARPAFPDQALAAQCTFDAPAATPTVFRAQHGRYNGQMGPNGWDNLADEAGITEAIRKFEDGPDWACFRKFYPGASTVYLGKK